MPQSRTRPSLTSSRALPSSSATRSLRAPLQDKVHRKTDYKYILCGKYSIAILRAEAELAFVIRILDTRTDYIRTIFGD